MGFQPMKTRPKPALPSAMSSGRMELVERMAVPRIGFVLSRLKYQKFHIFTCNLRAYANLDSNQIGFVLHFFYPPQAGLRAK